MTDPLSRGMLVLAASMLLQCCRRCCCYCGGGGGCLGAALKNAFANGWTQGWLSHSLTKQRQGKVPKTLPRGSPSGLMNAPPESQCVPGWAAVAAMKKQQVRDCHRVSVKDCR